MLNNPYQQGLSSYVVTAAVERIPAGASNLVQGSGRRSAVNLSGARLVLGRSLAVRLPRLAALPVDSSLVNLSSFRC